ncbi:MAG TPA: hypothetical protein VMU16_00605 [Candidatus Binataceae bacterium]|nr:hypothetical protein [Candidatus Binataceae bacterium]
MELVKNGTGVDLPLPDVLPITNAEREAVRKARKGGAAAAPAIKAKPGPHLEIVTFATLNKLWPWIHEGVTRIKKKDEHTDPWTPSHVRAAVERGLRGEQPCQLWFVKERDREILSKDGTIVEQPIGFLVATGYPDNYLSVPYTLWVWLAVGKPLVSRKYLAGVVKELKEYGRSLGFNRIRWATGRMNWAPIARKLGFRSVGVIWDMPLWE